MPVTNDAGPKYEPANRAIQSAGKRAEFGKKREK